ncbi:hypothetical protein OG909_21890 [Streptomyces sp. NBC_01754]|uniref:hypothetical protein n=1 Tax=Streptomyces sp. NBC_01754 TaxID=2975930 RepID=UPI002DDAB7B2|nr:hypothetical protein [Streptomyces sp. NBC_01754]WSC94716.1 hypothetical protein OG909_21890 [Streptomyces sp. NBC_01754]
MDEETRHPTGPDTEHPVCARCGVTAAGDTPPATWACSVEDGRRQYFCEDCARTGIRAIESRLDSDRW